MAGMSGSDDRPPGPDEEPVERYHDGPGDEAVERPEEEPVEPDERPLSRLAERFRIPLGALVTLIGLGLAVLFLTQPPELADGTRGTVEHVALVGLWVLIAAAGATYAFGAPRRVTNLCAAAGLAAYAVVWISGL